MKSDKEKRKYNVFQNTAYVIKNAWRKSKTAVIILFMLIFIAVAVSTVSILFPKAVVKLIIEGSGIKPLLICVAAFTALLIILNSAKAFLNSFVFPYYSSLRIGVGKDILLKTISTDYQNLEKSDFILAQEKAIDQTVQNQRSCEKIYYCLIALGTSLLGFFVYLILLVTVNPVILLLTAVTTLFGYFAARRVNKWRHDNDSELAGFNKKLYYLRDIVMDENLSKDLRLFSMTGWIDDIYNSCLKLYFNYYKKVGIKLLLADLCDIIGTMMREGAAYAYLIYQVLYCGMTVDNFVLLFAAIGGFSAWVSGILTEFSNLSMHSLNYCRIREFLEYPETFNYEKGESVPTCEHYTLELKNVSFKYPGAESFALKNINLKLEAGENLAVVGLNGAGKTTLVKLFCGLYDADEGEVLLNGKNIKLFNRREYYGLFTAVFQEFNILPLSIAENVAQMPIEEIDKARLKKCLELADIDAKVNSLPEKEQSTLLKSVLEDATELSGGETQRLMLARALYKNSPILILDEPTAALDPIAESRLYEHYSELSGSKSSIYISHRLASTRFCDRIVLISGNEIAECGTHNELMALGGKYAELFEIQSAYYKSSEEVSA